MPVYTIETSRGASGPEFHDTTHSPVGLWQLNEDLSDVSGEGNDLAHTAGTARHGPAAVADEPAFFFGGGVTLRTAAAAVLQIAGDVTVEVLVFPHSSSGTRYVCTCAEGGETEGANHLYGLRLKENNVLSVFMERNGGNNIEFEVSDQTVPRGQWSHLAYTRSGSTHRFYRNGRLVGDSSSVGLPTKGGSPSQRLFVGSNESGGEGWVGMISSLKVVAGALTTAQILEEARRTLPPDVRP